MPPAQPKPNRMVIVQRDPLLGRRVAGRFEVHAAVARGTSGRVYRATDRHDGTPVAVKVLDGTGGEFDVDAARRRFAQEARTLRSLHHDHTVRIVDAGTWEGVDYIAMEFVEGQTLQAALESGPLPVGQALSIARQICGSLDEAHQQGIVHRDLKPGNVLLTQRGDDPTFVKVVDFGLVKDLDAGGLQATLVGRIVGSPLYMAPEQIRGRSVDARTDLYALGGILFHMVAGRRAFDQDTTTSVLMAHLLTPVPSLVDLAPPRAVPAALETLVRRLLAKDPDQRLHRAADVADALAFVGSILAGQRPWQARLPGIAAPATARPGVSSGLEPQDWDTLAPMEDDEDDRDDDALPAEPTLSVPPGSHGQPIMAMMLAAAAILLLGVGAGLVLATAPPEAPAVHAQPVAARR